MGLFDGVTANLFREDSAGRRVYAPFGKWGGVYLVPDASVAARIATVWRRFYQIMLVSIIGVGIAFGWSWQAWSLVPIAVAASLVVAQLQTKGLERITASASDLQPVTRAQAVTRYAKAVGKPLLWTLLGSSLLLTAAGIWMITTGAGIMAWGAAGFFGLCTLSFVLQLRRVS